jgi:hypothetical protein
MENVWQPKECVSKHGHPLIVSTFVVVAYFAFLLVLNLRGSGVKQRQGKPPL